MLPARHSEWASQAAYGIASSGQFIRSRDSGMLKVITPARIHDVGVVRRAAESEREPVCLHLYPDHPCPLEYSAPPWRVS